MPKPVCFEASLWQPEDTTGYAIRLDLDPRAVFGKVRAPVCVTINGFTYRSTIASRGGCTFLVVNKGQPRGLWGGAWRTVPGRSGARH